MVIRLHLLYPLSHSSFIIVLELVLFIISLFIIEHPVVSYCIFITSTQHHPKNHLGVRLLAGLRYLTVVVVVVIIIVIIYRKSKNDGAVTQSPTSGRLLVREHRNHTLIQ